MNHLDEGTIHAWLDGALDSAQAADVEGHVATCAPCAEAVAEARGIMAAASGIMRALDDDRVNVVPRTAPAGVVPITQPRPVRRIGRWVGAAAAVLVAAVALQTSRLSQHRAMPESIVLTSESATLKTDTSLPAPPVAAAPAVSEAATPVRPPVARRQAIGRIAGGAGSAANATTGSATRRDGGAPAAPAPASAAASDLQQAEASPAAQTRVAKTAADESAALRALPTLVQMTPTERLIGCYRLDPSAMVGAVETGKSLSASVGAATANRARGARAPSVATAPAARAEFADARLPTLVRLDTARVALGLAVLRSPGDSAIGAWSIVRDSALVDLGTRGVVRLGVTQKVSCPEP